eukprot:TRINITY_DN8798_c0_g1_i5.p5 TRINITY_DN8798_c0_g1~~TRINITY_DN8798_c0_g1_i5.p5  ORF type:complete len:106 (+),score=16.47 TRINITY_DN8798_c0_g1_i5:467-784(+)
MNGQQDKKEDSFRTIMNRFKHLEMSKSDNLIFDEFEEENKNANPNAQVASKASLFEKINKEQLLESQQQKNIVNNSQRKSQGLQKCESDPNSVRGRAALFDQVKQ